MDHRHEDRRGLRRGAMLGVIVSSPAVTAMAVDLTVGGQRVTAYRDAGAVFLTIVGPYALIVLAGLGVYGALRWEFKYLASAVILGPFTLLRPFVVLAATVVAVRHTPAPGVAITAILAAASVLLVEPVLNRRYR
ncbi:hypothetical protein [Nocardioides sp. CER19]|uniref:hypothetical protein n=1 Tax=Nocardioides sp. CER19 TaxID=3038538 RepID=UPI00244935D3|nr:hypothetical protein [Nocardioides sp. CER19]MDH2413873.1 hypothetical protein [Nocardioides sp. CER19]